VKIAVIASTPERLHELQEILERSPGDDQFVFLQRHGREIHLDRVDLFSTNILILDSDNVVSDDLRLIAKCTREHVNPAVLYLCGKHSETELLELMRAGVTEVVNLPLASAELRDAIERIRSRHYISSAYRPRGKVLSFISCKGGAGATFIATNLGYALATECHQKVLLIDLHMQYGDASFYLTDKVSHSTLADIVKQSGLDSTVVATASLQIAPDYFLLQAPESPEKAAGIQPQHIDNLLTVAIQDYDFVIVDLPLTLDALSMKALDRSDRVFPVMQPMVPYLRAMGNLLHLFSMLGYDAHKVSVLLNRTDETLSISMDRMEDVIQKKIDRLIPNDFMHAGESSNTGLPILKVSADSPISTSLREMAKDLSGVVLAQHKPNLFKKLFG
jgi:pilus assembly protein CpaE